MNDEEKKAKLREYQAKWRREKRAKDPEFAARDKAAQKRCIEKNYDLVRKRAKDRYKENPEPAKAYALSWHEKNREASLENKKQWNIRNGARLSKEERELRETKPEIFLLSGAKTRARKNSLPFDLVLDDIKIPAYCPILGIPLEIGRKKASPGSPTLDRIRNELGYTKDNVWVISYKANTMKSSACLKELRLFCTEMLKKIEEWENV